MSVTRKETKCKVFGSPQTLKGNMFPTFEEVMKHYLWVKHDSFLKLSKKDPAVSVICEIVVSDIEIIWKKTEIPLLSHLCIIAMLKAYHAKYKLLKKNWNRPNFKQKIESFQAAARTKLFDISACKCKDFNYCKCNRKVPTAERSFLLDQRRDRKIMIGSVDLRETKKLTRKMQTLQKAEERAEKEKKRKLELSNSDNSVNKDCDAESISGDSIDEEDLDVSHNYFGSSANSSKCDSKTDQMRKRLPNLAIACDRAGVSDRSGALIATAILKDFEIVSADDPSNVVDRNKLRRERQKVRDELKSVSGDVCPLAIYFDGRKDKTLDKQKIGNRVHLKRIVEEHVVLLTEPGSSYLGHVTPDSGSAESIQRSILEFTSKNNISLEKLICIGSDGTVVNTGARGGVISKLESVIGRPLHWFICLLHLNELPLRHLFKELDGVTSGPKTFTGLIGKQLENCHLLNVVNFKKISSTLPELIPSDLSTDQKYLYEICSGLSKGEVSFNFSQRDPGKMSHARWLTTANRILRLYISTAKPTTNLVDLATFIVRVYAPTWFEIKTKPYAKDGPRHLLGMISKANYLKDKHKQIIQTVIQRNGFFAHPENILFAMLEDEHRCVRELAVNRIIQIRTKTNSIPNAIRRFVVPKINIVAENYVDLIDWTEQQTEPPITKHMSQCELLDVIDKGAEFPKFPCHSQAVERHVKLVTEASSSVSGVVSRDGFIRSRIESRSRIPIFESKHHFFYKNEKP